MAIFNSYVKLPEGSSMTLCSSRCRAPNASQTWRASASSRWSAWWLVPHPRREPFWEKKCLKMWNWSWPVRLGTRTEADFKGFHGIQEAFNWDFTGKHGDFMGFHQQPCGLNGTVNHRKHNAGFITTSLRPNPGIMGIVRGIIPK